MHLDFDSNYWKKKKKDRMRNCRWLPWLRETFFPRRHCPLHSSENLSYSPTCRFTTSDYFSPEFSSRPSFSIFRDENPAGFDDSTGTLPRSHLKPSAMTRIFFVSRCFRRVPGTLRFTAFATIARTVVMYR